MENLNIFNDLQIPHLSAYALTVEAGTALDLFIKKGKYKNVSSTKAAEHFDLLMQVMKESGYEHYEISNFARPGHYAHHNTAYWQQKNYLGIGPSAHSYNGHSRQWNVAAIKPYLDGIEKGEVVFEKEILSPNQKLNEYVMTSLRTQWGMDLNKVEQDFGVALRQQIEGALAIHVSRGHLETQVSIVRLTDKGKHFADGIAADLFMEDSMGFSPSG
jgi:oxygen-independent coproporphyrinogen-3 oxidase